VRVVSLIRDVLATLIWFGVMLGTYSAAKAFALSMRKEAEPTASRGAEVVKVVVLCLLGNMLIGWFVWAGIPFDRYSEEIRLPFSYAAEQEHHYIAVKIFLVLLISASVGIYRAFKTH
jgi:hypothetical protein